MGRRLEYRSRSCIPGSRLGAYEHIFGESKSGKNTVGKKGGIKLPCGIGGIAGTERGKIVQNGEILQLNAARGAHSELGAGSISQREGVGV